MDYQSIILDKRQGIAVLTINRPRRLNAANEQVFAEMKAALAEVEQDVGVRVLVLTGAGRAFCAGADLSRDAVAGSMPKDAPAQTIMDFLSQGPQMVTRLLHGLSKPAIAMVNGVAAGAGFDWALACDIRIGSEHARFTVGTTNIGAVLATGSVWLMPRIMGLPRAAELLFTGAVLDARDAERYGLLNKLVPAATLEAETVALARRIADGPPLVHRLNKQALYQCQQGDLDQALKLLAATQVVCMVSDDYQEGLAAFRDKRRPIFRGQ